MKPLTVSAIQTARISLPARKDLVVRGARGTHALSDFLLVRVQTSDGVEGYGEVSATALWSGEDGCTAEHVVRDLLAPVIINRPLTPPAALERAMDRAVAANPFTKAGVSMALWDAYARALGVPLAVALGGPFRDEVPVKCSLSGDGTDLDRTYEAALAEGFRAFKVKVGLGLSGDVARVAQVRSLVGPTTLVGVDANGGWSRGDARRAVHALEPYDPAFVEQPVAAADLDGLAAVRAAGAYVVADESVYGVADLTRVIHAHAADMVSVYVGKAAGPGRAVELGRIAAAFGVAAIVGSNGELGLGAAAQVHVACALPDLSLTIPSDIIGAHYYATDILATPLDNDGVRVILPDGPGLGVTLTDEMLRQFH